MSRKERFNSIMVGLNLGIVAPILTIIIIYYVRFEGKVTVDRYIEIIRHARILSSMISLAALSNLALFFLFLWTDLVQSAKGVVIATMLWGGVIVFLKFF